MFCKSCGSALPTQIGSGRPRTFCSDECRITNFRKNLKEHGRNEWYSPQHVVDAARRVMGSIDLDPASCYHANQIVRATGYYTRADDGLSLPWRGRVWLNPPYDTFAPKFFVKFCEEYEAGRIPMACLLLGVHHLTTKWFQRIEGFAALVSLPAGRLKFTGRNAHGNEPMHGSAILGVGVNPDLFRREFGEIGIVLELQARQPAKLAAASSPLVLISNRA